MADEKKPKTDKGKGDKKDDKKSGGPGLEALEIFILVVLIAAFAVIYNFSGYFNSVVDYFNGKSGGIVTNINSVTHFWSSVSLVYCAVLSIGLMYSIAELVAIRSKEHKIMEARVVEAYKTAAQAGDKELNFRWKTILELAESQNQNDWRQAILDADSVLDQILAKGGFIGDSIGERLTNATKGDIKTLDQAWEAHKVRNMIAHDGSTFNLTQYEAKRVINLYKQVFEEFYFI